MTTKGKNFKLLSIRDDLHCQDAGTSLLVRRCEELHLHTATIPQLAEFALTQQRLPGNILAIGSIIKGSFGGYPIGLLKPGHTIDIIDPSFKPLNGFGDYYFGFNECAQTFVLVFEQS